MLADALRISGRHALGDCHRARDSGQQHAERPHPRADVLVDAILPGYPNPKGNRKIPHGFE